MHTPYVVELNLLGAPLMYLWRMFSASAISPIRCRALITFLHEAFGVSCSHRDKTSTLHQLTPSVEKFLWISWSLLLGISSLIPSWCQSNTFESSSERVPISETK